MTTSNGGWVALFSGGKDASWALHRALADGYDVRRLAIVRPPSPDHAYHTPAPSVARLAARSVGIPVVEVGVPVTDLEPPDVVASAVTADAARDSRGADDDGAIEPLESALRRLDDEFEDGLAGIVAGTVSSEHGVDRLRSMADGLGCAVHTPLWGADPRSLALAMIDGGLEIVIAEVTAPGFDASWLGRRLDREALSALEVLGRDHGVHLLGEGGEYETIVTDGPHMACPIELEFERVWEGTWGRLRITDARLGTPATPDDGDG